MAMAVHTTIPGKKNKKGDGGNMAVWCKQLIFNSFDMIQFKVKKAIETPHSKGDNPECRAPTSLKQHIYLTYLLSTFCMRSWPCKISPVFTSSHRSLPPSTRKKHTKFPHSCGHHASPEDLRKKARISNRFVSHLDPWNTESLDTPPKKRPQS